MSEKATFTPGPWAVEPITHLIEKSRKEGKPTFYTASIIPATGTFRGYVCHMQDAEHIDGVLGPECEANARLIAAAPEMFALLERMENGPWPDMCPTLQAYITDIRALLAKVRA